jgi:CheY-like chemotaxis protein
MSLPSTLGTPVSTISGGRILVVDDNRDAAHTLARLLAALGCQAREANSGAEAIAAIECEVPDIVLLDLGMADMDGIETAQQIKSRFGESAITLIAITGLGRQEDRERTREAGFASHLVKPVLLEQLEQTLGGFLPRKRTALA